MTGCASSLEKRAVAIKAVAAHTITERKAAVDQVIASSKTAFAADQKLALEARLGRALAPADQPALQKLIDASNRRLQVWGELKLQKDTMDTYFDTAFGENQKRAERIGAWKTGIGVSGITAGIGATVLLAASPQNAVLAGALSGFAGGVAGMNSVFDNNGYSREQIAALETTVAQQYAVQSKQLKIVSLLLLALDPATTDAKFQEEVDRVESALRELRSLSLTLRIPSVTPKAG
jgi:hypothetical protein